VRSTRCGWRSSAAPRSSRAYSYDVKQLVEIIERAVRHKGFAFVDVLQPCPTYNDLNTKDWYGGVDRKAAQSGKPLPRVQRIGEKDLDPVVHEPAEATAKLIAAIKLAQEWGDRIPIGVFYQNEFVPTFEDRIGGRISTYIDQPPAFSPIADEFGASTSDITSLVAELQVTGPAT